MIDIESYRHLKSLPIESIYGEVIRNLCNKGNLTLWQEGITNPTPSKQNPNDFSEAFSHYQGFKNTMINLAQQYAEKNCLTDPDCRFAANDLEFVLDPNRIAPLIPELLQDMTEGDRRRMVTSFIKESTVEAKQARTFVVEKKNLP